jgi:hypothetical protein
MGVPVSPRVRHPRLQLRAALAAAALVIVAGAAAGFAGAAQRQSPPAATAAARTAAAAASGRAGSRPGHPAQLVAYRGLGSWVDLYDASAWNDPAAAVQDMAAHGVRTVFLETANYHNPSSSTVYRPDQVAAFIQACHARGMYVVAWYLPGFKNLDKDYNRSAAAIDFRTSDGQKFDSFGLDIEDSSVKPASERSARMKTLSERIRAHVGASYPLGGITPSPKGMTINDTYWPAFPYKTVADIYDVILPMGYYTYHVDGYNKVYSETLDNVRIVREQVGLDTIPIHLIAGLGDKSSGGETTAFVRATRETGILGASMYDWSTTGAEDWAPLANVRFNPVEKPALPLALPYVPALGNCPQDSSHPKEVFYTAKGATAERVLHFRLWDVQADEVRLVVNWQDAGALDPGPKGKWSGVRSLAIPASMLDKTRNVIGFVAAGDAPDWKRWGVREVSLVAP